MAVGTRNRRPGGDGERSRERGRELEVHDSPRISLKLFLERVPANGGRARGESFSFDDPITAIIRALVIGEKTLRWHAQTAPVRRRQDRPHRRDEFHRVHDEDYHHRASGLQVGSINR